MARGKAVTAGEASDKCTRLFRRGNGDGMRIPAYLHMSTIASERIAEAEEVRDEGPSWLRSTRKMPDVA
jgi:hypothetical protein